MRIRLMHAGAIVALAACGTAPSQVPGSANASQAQSDERPFTTTEVAKFESPWAMAFLPGSGVPLTNMALVSEKEGRLWLLDVATGKRQAVSGVPTAKVAGQGGLGDVVVHPGFAANQRVYLSYVEAGSGDTSGAAIGYGRLVMGRGAPRIEGFRVIWRQTPKVSGNGHFSHRIAFAPDGTMFVTSGDRQKLQPAQDLGSDLGKILHLTAEGQPVANGPFASRSLRARSYWSYGHRNMLGISFAPDGRLWVAEMGPEGGDELNLIERGKNYGYPIVSYGSHYGGRDIPDAHKPKGFVEPKVWWNPSISPGGMMIYTGDLFPQWKGDALIAALSGLAFIRVDINGDRARKADQWDMEMRVRGVDQGPRGEVYLIEDGDTGGRIFRLEPKR